jgi:ankyrin repeat protein
VAKEISKTMNLCTETQRISLFDCLPTDIQRLVCFFLSDQEVFKLSPKFSHNENDVYWKIKLQPFKEEKPKTMTYRAFYESFFYEKAIEQTWNKEIFDKMIHDDIFLARHINVQNSLGQTALSWALAFRIYDKSKPRLASCVDIKIEDIKKLIDAGADVNTQNVLGSTGLMYAISNKEIVQMLLDAGANVNIQNKSGYTALMLAISHKETFKMLLDAGADVNLQDKNGKTVLHAAYNDEELFSLLLNYKPNLNLQDNSGQTVLMLSAGTTHIDIVEMLIGTGADIHLQDNRGETSLFKAAMVKSKPQNLRMLIEAGANVNHENYEGKTAFYMALMNQGRRNSKILIAAGAKIHGENAYGTSKKENRKYLLKHLKDNKQMMEFLANYNL